MCGDYPPASILYLYFSFSFDESPIYVIISSFLRFWLVVASMYLLFLSVRSTFHTRFKPVCSSIYFRTSIGQQSNNKRTSIEYKALLLPCIIGATPWLHFAIYGAKIRKNPHITLEILENLGCPSDADVVAAIGFTYFSLSALSNQRWRTMPHRWGRRAFPVDVNTNGWSLSIWSVYHSFHSYME